MQNSLINLMFPPNDAPAELLAPGSTLRLRLIALLFVFCTLVIAVRVAWVQTQLPQEYITALVATTTEEELIPARDGRILAGSLVLAADVEQFVIRIHYRWLQQEPDERWMRLQLRERLSREERRDEQLTAEAELAIRNSRLQLRRSLCEITGVPETELETRCRQIEARVERISESVNRRARQKSGKTAADADDEWEDSGESDADADLPGLILRGLSFLRDTLTTPPQRSSDERIVVREEESWHDLLSPVSLEIAAKIQESPEVYPGIRVTTVTRRVYPEPQFAVHVVGARTHQTEEHSGTSSLSAAQSAGRSGRFGVEKSYDRQLRGVPGLRRIVRDRRQRVISDEIVRNPVSGRDVVLSIDPHIQQVAEQLLAESLGDADKELLLTEPDNPDGTPVLAGPDSADAEQIPTGGCIVVMEADSGRILAAASAPDFDLSLFTDSTREQWDMVNTDSRRPFVSRFTGMALPPGSTFKVVTAMAALHQHVIRPDEVFPCTGFLSRPDEHRCLIFRLYGRGHGEVTLRTAMAQSCNVYFFDAAGQIGIRPLVAWAERLGFGAVTGADLPFEKPGTLPVPRVPLSESDSAAGDRVYERETLGLSIGQSRLTATPLQMARLMALVANGGWLVTPHVVSDDGIARRLSDADHSPFQAARVRIAEADESILNPVREGMLATMEHPAGTGYRYVRIPGVRIYGKTGTAEASPGTPDHAWFAGYVPAEDTNLVFVIVLEHGGSGSRAAGPVARQLVLRGLLNRSSGPVSRLSGNDEP